MTNHLAALFGGTFDPIHNGHLLPTTALAKEVGIKQINLMPNYIPAHKPQPQVSTEQRLAMLKLAIEDNPLFTVDSREIMQANPNEPSYTIDTLKAWRLENGTTQPLAFIIGYDSFFNLPTWKEWQQLTNYCHVLVCKRTGFSEQQLAPALEEWALQHKTTNLNHLHHCANGFIYFADTPLADISATEIRNRITNKQDYKHLLPSKVWQYIQSHHLYGA